MRFVLGWPSRNTEVEIKNKQSHVEYQIVSGYASEKDIRGLVGNCQRNEYSYFFTGYYSDRPQAIERMEGMIKEKQAELDSLRFALKVTKKRKWIEIQEQQ